MRRDFLECREKLSKISITNSDFSILTPQHEIDFYLNNFKNIKEILLFEFGNKEICNLIDKIINEDISNEEYSNDITKLRNNSSYIIRRLKNYIDYISKE